jgi:hypothetical protein
MAMACVHFHPVLKKYEIECFRDARRANLQTSRALPQFWDKTYSWKFENLQQDKLRDMLRVDESAALVREFLCQYYQSVSKVPLLEDEEAEEVRRRVREEPWSDLLISLTRIVAQLDTASRRERRSKSLDRSCKIATSGQQPRRNSSTPKSS